MDIDNDTNEEIFSRKKAWAELERDHDEVRSDMRTLMRKAPESNEIDNPLLAQRVAPSQPSHSYRVPQDVILEKKHNSEFQNVQRERQASEPAKSRAPTKSGRRDNSESNAGKTREKSGSNQRHLSKDKDEDLSLSSQSKA